MSSHRKARIVALGGGTGLPVLLAGLRRLGERDIAAPSWSDLHISAIVTVADNGGSSGRLRQALKVPAVGDLRNCVTALAGDTETTDLFQHRFLSNDALHGHSLGNLMLAALCQRSGSLKRAADLARDLLQGGGMVLPVTEQAVDVCACFDDGQIVRGEVDVVGNGSNGKRINRIWLESSNGDDQPLPAPGVIEAIRDADVVVLGPGSMYTSIVPNLAVPGVADAIRETMALRVLVCNLMTQPGETDDFSATDHISAIEDYLGKRILDVCVLSSSQPRLRVAHDYRSRGSEPVSWDAEEIIAHGIVPLVADITADLDEKVRHDPNKLARVIAALAARVFPPPELNDLQLQRST